MRRPGIGEPADLVAFAHKYLRAQFTLDPIKDFPPQYWRHQRRWSSQAPLTFREQRGGAHRLRQGQPNQAELQLDGTGSVANVAGELFRPLSAGPAI